MAGDREITLLPPGVRFHTPPRSRTKRNSLNRLLDRARRWGFEELDLPTLDFHESITRGISADLARRTYQFHDDQGKLLALRPDATAQVAKILSGRLDPGSVPGRYCYVCRVFRAFELRRGELREFEQFGAEIIDSDRLAADVELLMFMFERLAEFDLEEVVVDLGHVQVYKGLMEDLDLPEDKQRRLRREIHRKNVGDLRGCLEETSLPDAHREALLALPTLYGGEEVFDRVQELGLPAESSRRAVDHLHDVYTTLETAGFAGSVSLDFGVVRDLDYYTGIVFEALLPGAGKPVVGGGRYDNLYGRYGTPRPATGFAVEVDRLLPFLEAAEAPAPPLSVWCPEPTPEAREALRDLRRERPVRVSFAAPPEGSDGERITAGGERVAL